MAEDPKPIEFTVVPLGRAYIPEIQGIITLANAAQKAFKFQLGAKAVPIPEGKPMLDNEARDLREVVRDLLNDQNFEYSTSKGQLIFVTSEPTSDKESARDYEASELYEQCYFFHDNPVPGAKNVALISTYVWDMLPKPVIAKIPTTALGRRALQPYILFSFAMVALTRCIDMDLPSHPETRGCPLDFCDAVQDIDRFFEGGRLCKECVRFLQGKITPKNLSQLAPRVVSIRTSDPLLG